MRNLLKQALVNPLAPFILILTLIILLSIIVSNLREIRSERNKMEKETFSNPDHSFQTGIFSGTARTDRNAPDKEKGTFVADSRMKELCAEAMYDWNRGDYESAGDKLKTVLVFQPSNQLALSHLGLLYLKREEYPAAEIMFRDQMLYYPSNTSAYLNLGYVLMKQNRMNEAMETIRRALLLDSNSPAVLIAIARLHAAEKRNKFACEYLLRAVRAHPDAILQIRSEPDFEELRKTPEYKMFLRDVTSEENKSEK